MTIEISKLSHDGRGVGRDATGKTVFIEGALPGERVKYCVTRRSKRFDEARIEEIIVPVADRVLPACEHFLTCGGCAQQHISPEAQVAAKQQSVLEQLEHFGQVQQRQILPPLLGPVWGYRHKARLGVRYVIKKDKVLVGFRERQANYLAEINSCVVLHPKISALIMPLRNCIRDLDAYRHIAQIEVAAGDEQVALVFRNLEPLNTLDQAKLITFATLHALDLYLQPGNAESAYKLYPQDGCERLYYQLPAYGISMGFHPLDFTQINPQLNRSMLQQALALLQLTSQDCVLDLFCGIGNFTLPMAQVAAHVTGIEGTATMVQRAYENAARNNITNVEFHAADLTADQLYANWAKQHYTKVLLDPPRSGAAEVLPLIAKLAVQTIVYVSCNPATLARDSGILVREFGYTLAQVGIMDMFPHTLHVETMALFVKRI